MSYDWYNNEDAGDLEMMGRADYEGEMNAQRIDERRAIFTEAFDLELEVWEKTPSCEGCCADLHRKTDGVFDEGWALFYCSEKCYEEHGMHNSTSYEGREFPTYG